MALLHPIGEVGDADESFYDTMDKTPWSKFYLARIVAVVLRDNWQSRKLTITEPDAKCM